MKERPILFSGPMVQAILEGRKTQTRRIIKPQPMLIDGVFMHHKKGSVWESGKPYLCPKGKPGDRLWIKETFKTYAERDTGYCAVKYRVGEDMEITSDVKIENPLFPTEHWRPSIFMPRWASRITLEILGTRAERLHEIVPQDAINEGIELEEEGVNPLWRNYRTWRNNPCCFISPIDSYRSLWESINGSGSWAVNPWVWAITFQVIAS